MSDANRGEAARCLDIARAAAAALDLAKAERFAEKAMRLFPSDEVLARIANFPSVSPALPVNVVHTDRLRYRVSFSLEGIMRQARRHAWSALGDQARVATSSSA